MTSIFKSSGVNGDALLLVPPRIPESFERTETGLKRIRSENLNLLNTHFVSDSEQLIRKVEFFDVKKAKASAFAESLKSIRMGNTVSWLNGTLTSQSRNKLQGVNYCR